MIGATIAHYRITAKLGEGGMGIVYRASDTKLDRDVAIKVLPPEVANEPDRLARFEREAKTLASLNHPNIAAVYGVESAALIMELVEGPTLADRLNSGPIPQDEAISIAIQIAEALEAAHEKGIVHRDLKPANVKLTVESKIKLLDFGLAKAMESTKAIPGDPINSPTIVAASMPGVIMGTAGYMSPEQAKGHPVDRRADIWSFGVVLHEMLTGQRLFDAGTIAESIAEVLKRDIDLNALPTNTPPHVKTLLTRCLDRNPKTRLRDIGEARIQLTAPPQPLENTPTKTHTPKWPMAVAAVIAALSLALVPTAWFLKPTPDQPLLQVEISPPDGVTMGTPNWAQLSVSPDGASIVFIGRTKDGPPMLYLRRFSESQSVLLPGTENAHWPFWSPDSLHIGFFTGELLKRVSVSGSPPQVITNTTGGSGIWLSNGYIHFSEGRGKGKRIPATGGTPTDDVDPDDKRVLEDGDTALTRKKGQLFVSSKAGKYAPLALPIRGVSTYVPNRNGHGWIFFRDTGKLLAQSFDEKSRTLLAAPVVLADSVPTGPSYSASTNGVIAFRRSSRNMEQLRWVSRDGKDLGALGAPGFIETPRISPDRQSVLYGSTPGPGIAHIMLLDVARNSSTRISSVASWNPLWTPDSRVLFNQFAPAADGALLEIAAGGHGRSRTLSKQILRPQSISADGQWLLSATPIAGHQRLTISHIDPTVQPANLITTHDDQKTGAISPNGRYIAYAETASGRIEVFVTPNPGEKGGKLDSGEHRRISRSGGAQPAWRGDGKELYFLAPDGKMMAAPVDSTTTPVRLGEPAPLFDTFIPYDLRARGYDVTADGSKFLIVAPAGNPGETPITVIFNWPKLLDRK